MTQLAFSPRSYERPSLGLPPARLINMYAELTPNGPGESVRLPRPGLVADISVGTGPVRGLYRQAGAFNGDRFIVSGSQLYREETLLGTILGEGLVRFAASATELVVISGGVAYLYDGALTTISDPDLPLVSDVAYLAGRFIYVQQGSDRFYYSAVNDAGNIDGLDFATAEGAADPTVAVAVLSDELFFFGAATVEIWFPTGDADAPFQRAQGRRYQRGCGAANAVVALDNTLAFVGEDKIVYRAGNVPARVSSHGVEEALRKCATLDEASAYYVSFEGHSFYVLNIPDQGTFALDVSTNEWAEWQSYERQTFRAQTAATNAGATYLGDDETGQVWTLDVDARTDEGAPIVRVASCFAPLTSGAAKNTNVLLQAVRGVGNADQPNPLVEMRFSDDAGRSWSDKRAASMGKVGEYAVKAIWRRLGLIRSPGRIYEFFCADPVTSAFQFVTINEARP